LQKIKGKANYFKTKLTKIRNGCDISNADYFNIVLIRQFLEKYLFGI
jgi:hypothetical protein